MISLRKKDAHRGSYRDFDKNMRVYRSSSKLKGLDEPKFIKPIKR